MNITWLKLSVDIFSDAKIRKIRRLPDGDQMCLVWLGILCMAMKSCRPGLILICDDMPANAEDISDFVDIPCAIVEKAIAAFEQLGMVRYANGGTIDVLKFSEHQQLDKIEAAKEAARLRMLEYRRRANPDLKPRKSLKNTGLSENKRYANVTRTQRERDATDIEVHVQSQEEKEKDASEADVIVFEHPTSESHPNPKPSPVPRQHYPSRAETAFIGAWVSANGEPPILNKTMVCRINTIAKELGDAFYLALPGFFKDDYTRSKGYPVGLLQSNPNAYMPKQSAHDARAIANKKQAAELWEQMNANKKKEIGNG